MWTADGAEGRAQSWFETGLDTGEWLEGSLMLRWLEASSSPEPSLRLLPLSEVRAHLPKDTAMVTPDMRQEALRRRRRGAQLRRRW